MTNWEYAAMNSQLARMPAESLDFNNHQVERMDESEKDGVQLYALYIYTQKQLSFN